MGELPLAFAFTAGLFAVLNPCGFAMLPAYLGRFVLAANPPGAPAGVGRALVVGLAVSGGFATVFAVVGLAVRGLGVDVLGRSPWVTILIGAALVAYGTLAVVHRAPTLPAPRLDRHHRVASSMVLYGAAYAVVSLGCTLPTFLAYVAGTMTTRDIGSGLAVYGAYIAGFAVLLVALSVAVALAATGITTTARRLVPIVERASGVLLVAAGGYVAYYGWYELTRLGQPDPVIDAVTGWSTRLQVRLDQADPLRLGGLLAVVLAATAVGVVVARRRSVHQRVGAQFDGGPVRHEQVLGGPQQCHDLGSGQPVEDLPAVAGPIEHQPALAQTRQMPRHVRLGAADDVDEVTHSPFPAGQRQQDRDTSRVGEAAEHPRR